MAILIVGKPYIVGKRRWPEGVDYNFRGTAAGGMHEIRLFLKRPTREEVESVRHDRIEFALTLFKDLLILSFHLPGFGWADSTYDIHLVPVAEQLPPPVTATAAKALLILVNADDGVILALRQTGFSVEFTRILHEAIRQQLATPFNSEAHTLNATKLTLAYPQAGDLAKLASVRCITGKATTVENIIDF